MSTVSDTPRSVAAATTRVSAPSNSRTLGPPLRASSQALEHAQTRSAEDRTAVEADRDADDEGVVLARRDVDAVGVTEPEPGPGDLRDDPVPVADLEVLVDDVPGRLEPPPAGDVDGRAVVQQREHLPVHRGRHRAVAFDLHRVAERQQLLADGGQDGARGVLQLEGAAEAERLAVDEEDLVALLVGDPGVVADREEPFPYEIAHAPGG